MVLDNLSGISITRTNWHVKVRVTRMWQSFSLDEKNLIGTHLVLLDAKDCHRHAFVGAKFWKKFDSIIQIGKIFELSNFEARNTTFSHRPVKQELSIFFTESTEVKICENEDASIPNYKFEIVKLEELYQVAEPFVFGKPSRFATDIIGKVVDIQPIQMMEALFGNQPVIFFNITDGRNSFKVTFWGEQLPEVESLIPLLKKNKTIVILAGMRPFLNNGTIELGVTGGSKIYTDPEIPEIKAFRNRPPWKHLN